MSYPNSMKNSFMRSCQNSNKENEVPNFPTRQGNTPECNKCPNAFSEIPSAMINSIDAGCRSQITQQTLKTIMKQFYSQKSQKQKSLKKNVTLFIKMLQLYFEKPNMQLKQAICLCEKYNIYSLENVKDLLEDVKNQQQTRKNMLSLEQLLVTDLGHLKIQYLCQCIQEGNQIKYEQQNILQILFNDPNKYQQITEQMIWEAYKQKRQQEQTTLNHLQQLQSDFIKLCETKVWPKIYNKQLQNSLINQLKDKTLKNYINYKYLKSICSNLLSLKIQQINLIYRFIYYVEHKVFMYLVDPNKSIKTQTLLINLLKTNKKAKQQAQRQTHSRHTYFMLQDCYNQIQKLEIQNKKLKMNLKNKDQKISKLENMVELLEIQASQNQSINHKKFALQKQSYHNNYTNRITQLQNQYKQQKKLTNWYQRELQAIIKAVNRENVMRRYFAEQFKQDYDQSAQI